MKITTYRGILREMPGRLRATKARAKMAAADELEKLDLDTCSQEEVAAVLEKHEMHTSWARRPYCSCCDSEVTATATVESSCFHCVTICLSCAREAVQKLEAAK
jgi:hypothetical protein